MRGQPDNENDKVLEKTDGQQVGADRYVDDETFQAIKKKLFEEYGEQLKNLARR